MSSDFEPLELIVDTNDLNGTLLLINEKMDQYHQESMTYIKDLSKRIENIEKKLDGIDINEIKTQVNELKTNKLISLIPKFYITPETHFK